MNEILLRTEQEIDLDNKTQHVYENIIKAIELKGDWVKLNWNAVNLSLKEQFWIRQKLQKHDNIIVRLGEYDKNKFSIPPFSVPLLYKYVTEEEKKSKRYEAFCYRNLLGESKEYITHKLDTSKIKPFSHVASILAVCEKLLTKPNWASPVAFNKFGFELGLYESETKQVFEDLKNAGVITYKIEKVKNARRGGKTGARVIYSFNDSSDVDKESTNLSSCQNEETENTFTETKDMTQTKTDEVNVPTTFKELLQKQQAELMSYFEGKERYLKKKEMELKKKEAELIEKEAKLGAISKIIKEVVE